MKFHSSNALPESPTALMLLSDRNIDANQRISILSSATSHNTESTSTLTNEQLMDSVTCDPFASVLRQCDSYKSYSSDTLRANSTSFSRPKWNRYHRAPRQIAELKKNSRSKRCELWGHWRSDHTSDGTMKSEVKASKNPVTQPYKEWNNVNSKPNTHKKTMTFNIAMLNGTCSFSSSHFTGPLLDDGAPYSGLGLLELEMLSPYLRSNWNGKLDPLRSAIADRIHWQYGSGSHSSDSRRILGFIMVPASLNDGTIINISHIVIEGSSKWLIRRNIATKWEIIRSNGNALKINDNINIPLLNVDMHSFIPSSIFLKQATESHSIYQTNLFYATGTIHNSTYSRPWQELEKIIDKVHKHVRGHVSLSDIQILLQRNNLWSTKIEKYLIVFLLPVLTVPKHMKQNKIVKYRSVQSTNRSIRLLA